MNNKQDAQDMINDKTLSRKYLGITKRRNFNYGK